ncbi:unnamed protein product [Discosporangium mesarthrocarpum]
MRKRVLGGGIGRVSLFFLALPVSSMVYLWLLKLLLPDVQTILQAQPMGMRILYFLGGMGPLVVALFPLGGIDVAAGLLFHTWPGWPVALVTKTFGCVLCFLLSRHTCRSYLRRTIVHHYEWMSALGYMMEEKEFQTMALLRLSALPSAVTNYGSSSLRVSLGVFTLATALGVALESSFLVPVGAHLEDIQHLVLSGGIYDQIAMALGILTLIGLACVVRRTADKRIRLARVRLEDRGSGDDSGLEVVERGRIGGGRGVEEVEMETEIRVGSRQGFLMGSSTVLN